MWYILTGAVRVVRVELVVYGAAELEYVAPLVAVHDAVAALSLQELREGRAQRPARQQHAQQRARCRRVQ